MEAGKLWKRTSQTFQDGLIGFLVRSCFDVLTGSAVSLISFPREHR